jgi:hypothetical protein
MSNSDFFIRYGLASVVLFAIVGGLLWLLMRSGRKQYASMEHDMDKWTLRIFKTASDVDKLKILRTEFVDWLHTYPHYGEGFNRRAISLMGFIDGRIHECETSWMTKPPSECVAPKNASRA